MINSYREIGIQCKDICITNCDLKIGAVLIVFSVSEPVLHFGH
jgi:hypothetical protein